MSADAHDVHDVLLFALSAGNGDNRFALEWVLRTAWIDCPAAMRNAVRLVGSAAAVTALSWALDLLDPAWGVCWGSTREMMSSSMPAPGCPIVSGTLAEP